MKIIIRTIMGLALFVAGYLACHYGVLDQAIQFAQSLITKGA